MHMRNNIFLTIIVALCCTGLTACAQSKKARTTKTKKGSTKPELLVAINQKNMLPGRREAPPEYRFVIVWKDKNEPAVFFWKGINTWEVCDITGVINYNEKTHGYETTPPGKRINEGDTLELHPVTGGKHPIPQEVQLDAGNRIYYKTSTGLWKYMLVSSFEEIRKEDSGFRN